MRNCSLIPGLNLEQQNTFLFKNINCAYLHAIPIRPIRPLVGFNNNMLTSHMLGPVTAITVKLIRLEYIEACFN